MKLIIYPLLSLFLLLTSVNSSFARDDGPLEKEWLAKDIEAVGLLPKLTPIEGHRLEDIRRVMGDHTSVDEDDRGFGARTFRFSKGNGYTKFIVSGFLFNGRIGYYRVAVHASLSWPKVRKYIIEAWKQNSGLEFTEYESGIAYTREYPQVFQDYKSAVSAELGEMKPAAVPPNLRESYEYLISPMRNSVVGKGGCDYAGVTPAGKEAIDEIVQAKRIDLIENILKGYNPGGRVYAALALLGLEKQGVALSVDAQDTIKKIRSLDIKIETCAGCEHSFRTAGEVLDSP